MKNFILKFATTGMKFTRATPSNVPQAPGKFITQDIEYAKNKIVIKTVNTIDKVPREAWDVMVDDPYMTWGWLKTVEQTFTYKHEPYYIMVMDSDQLVGGAVCSVSKRSLQPHNLDALIFGRLKKFFYNFNLSLAPLLDCSSPIGRRMPLLINKTLDTENRQKISEVLLKKIEEFASSNKLAVAISGIKEDQSEFMKTLANRGYCSTLSYPIGILDIKWLDFDGYLLDKKALSSKMRYNIRSQIKRNIKAGVTITEIHNPENYGNKLHHLSSNNYEKHNMVRFTFNETFFATVKKNMGTDATIYIAEKKGEVVGVQLFLKKGAYGNGCLVGVDHETTGNDFTYFNLTYYTTIKDAIHSKMQTVDFGNGLYTLKTSRGCNFHNNYLYYRPENFIQKLFIPLWFRFHSFWLNRKLFE